MRCKNIFISGGAGFIGSNLAGYHLAKGDNVLIFDNLTRKGTESNIDWLKKNTKKGTLKFVKGDIRNLAQIKRYVGNSDVIYHMAAQVAVTTSLIDPQTDFEVNAGGTLNMLEAYRIKCPEAVFIYASTNKVYGGLEDIPCNKKGKRYFFTKKEYKKGISEDRNLDFHSPYGCSKGAGDQYVRDYARVYGLKTIVFRQSCIYGPRQCGNEDQGWVAHFARSAITSGKIKIFGDGCQVRDLLYINDLITAYQKAIRIVKKKEGLVYNIGGGVKNSASLLEVIEILEGKLGRKLEIGFGGWREGDQKVYITDISKTKKELDWKPKIGKDEGVTNLTSSIKDLNL